MPKFNLFNLFGRTQGTIDEDPEASRERAAGQKSFSRSLVLIIVVIIIIIILVIMALTWALTAPDREASQKIVQSTSAISQYAAPQNTQDIMRTNAKLFGEYITRAIYTNDPESRTSWIEAAKGLVATESDLNKRLMKLGTSPNQIPSNVLAPVLTEPQLQGGTKAYQGYYDWSFIISAANTQVDAGAIVNPGYDVIVRFMPAVSQETLKTNDGQQYKSQKWVIVEAWVSPHNVIVDNNKPEQTIPETVNNQNITNNQQQGRLNNKNIVNNQNNINNKQSQSTTMGIVNNSNQNNIQQNNNFK